MIHYFNRIAEIPSKKDRTVHVEINQNSHTSSGTGRDVSSYKIK